MTDWRALLREYLIAAGTDGRTQSAIIARLRNQANADELVEYLESLKADESVQRFVMASGARGGRPKTIWRATTKLLEVE